FLPVVIVFIPNKGSDTTRDIEKLYRKLVEEIVPQLQLYILLLGSDGKITEFQVQQSIFNTQPSEKLTTCEPALNINFSCSILDRIGSVICVQNPKHAKNLHKMP
ncbi:4546_t:CDS:1, partial [Gigaspora margarita]